MLIKENEKNVVLEINPAEKQQIVDFLRFAVESQLVYLEALVDPEDVLALADTINAKSIHQGELILTREEFDLLQVTFMMHSSRLPKNFEGFSRDIFDDLYVPIKKATKEILGIDYDAVRSGNGPR